MAFPDAALADDVNPPAALPSCLSSTAQARILIWRTEVASALAAPPKSSPSSSASTASSLPSAPSTATFTTTASPPGDDGAGHGKSGRRHRFWRRLVRRLSLRGAGPEGPSHAALLDGSGLPPDACPGGVVPGGEVIRTAMYRQDAAPPPPENNPAALRQEEDALHDADSSDDDVLRKQKKQQERLQRAARLLSQQNARPAALAHVS